MQCYALSLFFCSAVYFSPALSLTAGLFQSCIAEMLPVISLCDVTFPRGTLAACPVQCLVLSRKSEYVPHSVLEDFFFQAVLGSHKM